ncbi:MAG TPA: AAA domain-containing protein [Edaphocola sp.]|nr:AAA domain-containing protein [Edaphocola sp.]
MTYLQGFISKAYENLPIEKRGKPWTFVNHGVDLLKNEDELNCYLVAYGKMHEEKIHTALSTLKNINVIVKNKYKIIDWGCGQGLATICFLDYIKDDLNNKKPQSITLIEPSNSALTKAEKYIQKISQGHKTLLIEKRLDEVNLSDIKITEPVTINFFSNILDIESVNLERLGELINSNLIGEQYFICVGPMNLTSTRIDTFAKLLNCTDEQLIGNENGKLKTTKGTIKLLVFKIKGTDIEIIKSIYYPPMPKNHNIMHILDKKLKAIAPHKLKEVDRIIEYYKLVVELEQLKEPAIKPEDKKHYSFELNENNEFLVDLEKNEEFLAIFNSNRNPLLTPPFKTKDLNISLEIGIEEKKYSILNYTYLFEDIKDIDTSTEKVKLQLSSFELNYSSLTSKFEKNEEGIDELEDLIKQQNSIDEVVNILRANLGSKLTFDNKISFALSSKNPALSQIYSELRKLNSYSVQDNSLLSDFLFNKPIDNKMNDFKENDLIQISNLDNSQKNAVLTAFNNRVTVITGPPGSGKTQVISNILANAVLQDKKVLVASKNNQAVDNVKSRFDREENIGFFLRFGNAKKILPEITLPEINKISAFKSTLIDNSILLEESQKKLNEINRVKIENKRKLKQRDELQGKLPEFKKHIDNFKNSLLLLNKKNPDFETLRLNHQLEIIENYVAESKRKRNQFELKYSGLNKFWIDWFTKKKYAFELISYMDETHNDFNDVFNSIPNQIKEFKNGTKIAEAYNEILEILNSIADYYAAHSKVENELKLKTDELKKIENFITVINSQEPTILSILANCETEIIQQSKIVLKEKIENKLFNASHAQINNYKDYLPDRIPWRNNEMSAFAHTTNNFLDIFNIISVTSLSAKASLPLSNELFDMVVIDEASQCDIASAIPLILRAKQLVIIGDPLQLKHITSLNKFEEEKIKEHLHLSSSVYLKYKEKSLWDYSKGFLEIATNNNEVINLDRHYRSHKNIIGYAKEFFYPKIGVKIEICTKIEDFTIQPSGIEWIDVVGILKADHININEAEVEKSIEIARYFANQYPNISIGIVTPFRHQANEIINRLPIEIKPKITVGTAHEFQGDEKDVMIYSLVVTNNSPDSKIYWIDNMVPESVNVAITRARNTIYIVGNKEYIRVKSPNQKPLGNLLNYVEKLKNNYGLV